MTQLRAGTAGSAGTAGTAGTAAAGGHDRFLAVTLRCHGPLLDLREDLARLLQRHHRLIGTFPDLVDEVLAPSEGVTRHDTGAVAVNTVNTVKQHLKAAYRELDVPHRRGVVRRAYEPGLIRRAPGAIAVLPCPPIPKPTEPPSRPGPYHPSSDRGERGRTS